MEYEQQQNQEDGFMNRIKESPRTVSAVIIVLIVAAAIYAFSGNNQDQTAVLDEGAVTEQETEQQANEQNASEDAATQEEGTQEETASQQPAATPTPIDKSALMEEGKALPEARTTDTAYVEVAQRGDGLTHLARRAATRYLAERETGYQVTNEHRIYIEDYIQKRLAQRPVTIGMEESVSFDLIKQAVEAAGQLNEMQLKNLTKYTHALS